MKLAKIDLSNCGHDFLRTWDKTVEHIKATIAVAQTLRDWHKQGVSPRVFNSGIAISM